MDVALVWVVLAFIAGGTVGLLEAAVIGARRITKAETLAGAWREHAKRADRLVQRLAADVEELQAELARLRREARAAGEVSELRAVLADVPAGARVVAPCPTMGVEAGEDNWSAYAETVEAQEDQEAER